MMLDSNVRRSCLRGMSLTIMILALAGCAQEELPKTYVVQGKCILKNGKPLRGGFITFMSVSNPELRGYGTVGKDGLFNLNTVALRSNATSELLQGAVEGEFRVNIRPDSGATDSMTADGGPPVGGRQSAFTLKKTYTIEAKELNDITVVIE